MKVCLEIDATHANGGAAIGRHGHSLNAQVRRRHGVSWSCGGVSHGSHWMDVLWNVRWLSHKLCREVFKTVLFGGCAPFLVTNNSHNNVIMLRLSDNIQYVKVKPFITLIVLRSLCIVQGGPVGGWGLVASL